MCSPVYHSNGSMRRLWSMTRVHTVTSSDVNGVGWNAEVHLASFCFFFLHFCLVLLLLSSNTLPKSHMSSSSQTPLTDHSFHLLSVTVHYFLFHSSTVFSFSHSECVNAFALLVRPPTEQENLLFSFQLTGEDTVKSTWLRTLCRHVANTICRADAVSHTVTYNRKDLVWEISRQGRKLW